MSRTVLLVCPVDSASDSSISSVPNEQISIPEKLACVSTTIKDLIEVCEGDDESQTEIGPIQLPNVSASIMKLVVQYLVVHPNESEAEFDDPKHRVLPFSEWKQQFFAPLNTEQLVALQLAANYLDCKCLLHAVTKCMALRIKACDPEGIKAMFKFHGEFTPEQIAQAKADHLWLSDKA